MWSLTQVPRPTQRIWRCGSRTAARKCPHQVLMGRQSAPFGEGALPERETRPEPVTTCLEGRGSTTELLPHVASCRTIGVIGLEPTTSASQTPRASHLRHTPLPPELVYPRPLRRSNSRCGRADQDIATSLGLAVQRQYHLHCLAVIPWYKHPAGLHNFRRLVVRYEYHLENYLGFVQLGCIIVLLRHHL